jgi:hypothetical protein
MLAHAFLVMAALLQRIRHPPPPELIPLTCNEVSHLFVGLAARPLGHLPTGCAGRCGDADTRRAPVPATTAARRPGTMKITIYGWRIN